ncbi:MAG: HepT-like ribonuclease domain-containing protein [Pseudanabaenaceae cyanobacterium bins.39]|nr:HepT-like ribonuclease domain-containing protein [Pseudanabaenaceae cyanobacterium bins.39]
MSSEFRASHPEIDWDGMAGMRDILAHQYDRVNIQVVWDVVQTDLPPLLVSLQAVLKSVPS